VRAGAIGEAPYRVIGQIRMLAYVNVYRRQVSSADVTNLGDPRSRPSLLDHSDNAFGAGS